MDIKEIKNLFYGFRNGIVAKAFLDAGDPHKYIFGLQIPQIAEIARIVGKSDELADELWKDNMCRESRLLACRVFNPASLSSEKATELAASVQTREEADYLAFALLRHLHSPYVIIESLEKNVDPENPLSEYMLKALKRNIER